MSGLSQTGFLPQSLSDVRTEIENALKAQLGPQVNLVAPSLLATLVGILSEREALIWSAAEDVYNSQYPDTAVGVALDNVAAITGLTRLTATPTRQLIQYVFGDAGTVVPKGTQVSVLGNPSAVFATDMDVTLAAGRDCVQTISFSSRPVLGQFAIAYNNEITAPLSFSVSAQDIQAALRGLSSLTDVTVSGSVGPQGIVVTFSGLDGKQPQPLLAISQSSLTDGTQSVVTVTPTFQTHGIAQGTVSLTALATGAVPAPAESLTVIKTPVAGLSRTVNPVDAVIGRNTETDPELRIRRAKTLQVAGNATPDAIKSRLLNLADVTDVFLFENVGLLPDTAGRPPKSYEVVVNGGLDQSIGNLIFATKPAGIQTVGRIQTSVVDSQGFTQTVSWSRPTHVPVYLTVTLQTDYTYPADGDHRVVSALVAYGETLKISQSVILSPHLVATLDGIPGIVGITIQAGTAPAPTQSQNIVIQTAQIASFDTSRIQVLHA